MKKLLIIPLFLFIFALIFASSAFAADYYVFDAGELKDEVSFSTNMSMKNDSLFENGSVYISTGPLEDNYQSTNNTAVIFNFSNLAAQMKIKDYPVVKIGYKAMTEAEGTQITLNVHADTAEESAKQLYCATLDYEKTGENSYVLFNLATTTTGIKNNGWSKITADSPLYKLRIKPYISLKTMHTDDYFDIEYIGFFKTEADAIAYTFTLDKSLEDIIFNEQVIRVVKNSTAQLSYSFVPYYADVQTVSFASDNAQIATIDNTGKVTGVSAGVTTVRATAGEYSTACKVYVLEKELAPLELYPTEAEGSYEKIIVNSIGDSITTYVPAPDRGMPYHKYWAEWYNITNNNYGVSSTTVCPRPDKDNSFIERYPSMRDDAHLITVKGGTNDWGANFATGTLSDREPTTYIGGIRTLMEGLIEKYPNSHIVFFSPIKRSGDKTTNGNGSSLLDYTNALIELGAIYNIPVIDIYTPEILDFTSRIITPGGHDPETGEWHDTVCESDLMPDGLHPSGKGQKIMAEYMMNEMIELGIFNDNSPENSDTVSGDVNSDGTVDRKDLTRLAQYFARWDVEIDMDAADANGDGTVDRKDLTRLAQYFARWDVELGK